MPIHVILEPLEHRPLGRCRARLAELEVGAHERAQQRELVRGREGRILTLAERRERLLRRPALESLVRPEEPAHGAQHLGPGGRAHREWRRQLLQQQRHPQRRCRLPLVAQRLHVREQPTQQAGVELGEEHRRGRPLQCGAEIVECERREVEQALEGDREAPEGHCVIGERRIVQWQPAWRLGHRRGRRRRRGRAADYLGARRQRRGGGRARGAARCRVREQLLLHLVQPLRAVERAREARARVLHARLLAVACGERPLARLGKRDERVLIQTGRLDRLDA